jgi:hypothetical protein
MAREFQDGEFQTWEAFASTGEHGFTADAWIVFRCRTDPTRRPRYVVIDGDKPDAEARVIDLPLGELRSLLNEAQFLD